jgi:hypothetical protein
MAARNRAMEQVDPPLAPSWFPKDAALAWRLGWMEGRQMTLDDQIDVEVERLRGPDA